MQRILFGTLVLTGCLVANGWLVGADDKKDDQPKYKGVLPANWAKLGLSAEQRQAAYKILGHYSTEIDKLIAKVDELKTKRKAELDKILTDEQKKRLRELRVGDKPKDTKEPDSKTTPKDSKTTPKDK